MESEELFTMEWQYLLSCLPTGIDLDSSAAEYGAMSRRRNVGDASALLRLALAYGFCDMSLRHVAVWAEALGVASISNVALMKRLAKAADWLGFLVSAKLAESAALPHVSAGNHNICLVDATSIGAPGSRGTHFKLHLAMNLVRQSINQIEITDRSGGESLKRFRFTAGDLVIADAAYSKSPCLLHVADCGAGFLVRLNWWALPLETAGGSQLDLIQWLRKLPDAEAKSIDVQLRPVARRKHRHLALRLVALRKSEAATSQSRERAIRTRVRKGGELDPRTLELAGYICLVTSLTTEEASDAQVLDLYRFRWQIEMAFKRLKGLLNIGAVPAKNQRLGRTVVLAKLLAALIVADYTGQYLDISPWGYNYREQTSVSVAN